MSEVKRIDIDHKGLPFNDNDGVYVFYEDYAALEAKCAALTAENAGLKDYLAPIGIKVEGTPATDVFLSEVLAQGVEMFAQWCRGERDFTLIDEDIADAAAYEECVKRAEYFSAQLRKGGEQK